MHMVTIFNMPEESHIEQERSMLIAWLREVEQMRPRSPKVILIYLWKTPFELNEEEKINNPVYDAHAQLAKEFDFVVGHVNLATYFDEPNMPSWRTCNDCFCPIHIIQAVQGIWQ